MENRFVDYDNAKVLVKALKEEIPTKVSSLENDSNYVKNTDYATKSVGGVVKVQDGVNGLRINGEGTLYPISSTYTDYQNAGNTYTISKGTLENWLVGKDLTTKAYVDSLVGDIESALNEILGDDE